MMRNSVVIFFGWLVVHPEQCTFTTNFKTLKELFVALCPSYTYHIGVPTALSSSWTLPNKWCVARFFLDVGARNHRRFCAINYNKTPGFEVSEFFFFSVLFRSMQNYCSQRHAISLPGLKTGGITYWYIWLQIIRQTHFSYNERTQVAVFHT